MYLFKTTDVKPPHKLVYFDDKTNHTIDHIYVTACPGVSSELSLRDNSDETPEHAFSKEIRDNFATKSFVNRCSACIQVHVLALAEIVILKKLSAPFSGHQVRFKESFVSALREFMDSTGSGLDSRKRQILYNHEPVKQNFWLFSYPSVETCVLGAQKNCLGEMVLLSTHNICFDWEEK